MRSATILCVCLACSLCLAQGQDGLDGPIDPPALSGPRVEDHGENVFVQSFMPDEQTLRQRRKAEARAIPRILQQMSTRRTDKPVRLSQSQQQSLRAIREAFESDLGEFLESRREQIIADLGVLGLEQAATRLSGDAWDRSSEVMALIERSPRELLASAMRDRPAGQTDRRELLKTLREDQHEALMRLVEIQRLAPEFGSRRETILAVLSTAQRAYLEQRLSEMHLRQAEEARKGQMAQDMRDTQAMQAQMQAQMEDQMDAESLANRDYAAHPDRLARLVADLGVNERELLADFIERRLLERLQHRGRPKPAPSMDGVEVPPPV